MDKDSTPDFCLVKQKQKQLLKLEHEILKTDCFLKIAVKSFCFLSLSVEMLEWGGGSP